MDIATIIGFVLAFIAIIGSIALTGLAPMFIDIKSVLVVILGSIAAVCISFPLPNLMKLPSICKNALFAKTVDIDSLIAQLVGFAEIARRDGILSLENHMQDCEDDFIKRGIQMAVDGTDPELIEAVLETDLDNIDGRHETNKKILDGMGKYAPAFGMIGTLIGLVAMLGDMSDPSGIGAGMAVALLTTMYGAIMANAVFLPMADKLQIRHDEEMLIKTIIVKGVMSIQAGDNPRVVAQKLQTFIPASKRASEDDDQGGLKKAA
ncbi:MAG: motility protein A [Planctomycetota bacterium]